MGPDTEDRIKSITTAAAQQAAKEAVDLVYERLLPVLVQKQQRDNSLLMIMVDTMKHFIGQVELRILKK